MSGVNMYMLGLTAGISLIIAGILVVLVHLGMMKTNLSKESASPFECGFINLQPSRALFSLHFFLIAMVFLIFDIELVFLFPLLLGANTVSGGVAPGLSIVFVMLLSLGAFLEWTQKILVWTD